jgi:hypothetical protein
MKNKQLERSSARPPSSYQANNQQENHRPNESCHKRPEQRIPPDTNRAQDQAANDGAYNANKNIANHAKSSPPHHHPREPSGKPTNHNPDNPPPGRTRFANS